jgi:hypothetical protein
VLPRITRRGSSSTSSNARTDAVPSPTAIWRAVDDLVDRAPNLRALRAHRIHLLAARRYREQGLPVDSELEREESLSAVRTTLAPALLARIRDAHGSPIVVFKGPEVAMRYPAPELRGFVDLDLIVADPQRLHGALVGHGFEEMEDPPWAGSRADPFADKHHTRPLQPPGIPLKIELHRWPSWPRWLTPPPPEALLRSAVASALGVEGVLTLAPAEHALVLAAHSWVDEPLGRIRDLVDLTLLAAEADPAELDELAGSWKIERLWHATRGAAEATLLRTRPPTLPQRTWARNARTARERTVTESHVGNWVSGYWTLPPLEATRLAFSNIVWDLRPATGEPARDKLARAVRAVRHARSPKSAHDESLGKAARRFSPVRRWRRPPGPEQ